MSTPKKPVHAEGEHVTPVEDEVVHVPKGKSKVRFLLTLGLMLFVLVIFTVGDQLMTTVGGGRSRAGTYLTWEHPTQGPQAVSFVDYTEARRALDDFFRAQGQRPSREQLEDDNLTYLLITDRLARDAGMAVARKELAKMLLEGQRGLCAPFFNEANYRAALGREGVSPASFESTLAWLVRVTRYEGLMLTTMATPSPQAVEQAWKAQHNEYAFEVVGVKRDELRSEAQLEEPDEAALKAWYEALDAGEKGRLFRDHYTPERISAELLSWTPGTPPPAALLERFPAPEGVDPAVAGRTHYDLYQHVRYRRPEPSEPEGETPPAEEETPDDLRDELYLPYEDVAASAADEARVRAALEGLLADLRARKAAGETLDLAALAAELGLEHQSDGLPRSVEEWTEAVDDELVIYLRTPGEGNLLRQPVVGATRLWVGQVLERLPSAPPAFEDVREQAREAWLEQRAGELARERLQKVYDALVAKAGVTPVEGESAPAVVDAADADFAAALSEAGLSASAVEWFDPARDAGEPSEDPALEFLRSGYFPGAPLFALAEGQVAAPQEAGDGESVWLVRGRGKREPTELAIRPAEYENLRQSVLYESLGKIYERVNSPEALAERFQVRYPGRLEEGDAGDAGDGAGS
jgi:hypothetical protein